MTLHDRLKSETWPMHQKVDGIIMRQLKSQDFSFLNAFRRWYNCLQDKGFRTDIDLGTIRPDFSLQKAIATLPKVEDKVITSYENYQDISDEHQFLGIYYVIRGSAHGSRYVLPTLRHDSPARPYFEYMAALPDVGWQSFLDYINTLHEDFHGAVISSAKDSFIALESFLKSQIIKFES